MIQCDTIGMWLGANCHPFVCLCECVFVLQCRGKRKKVPSHKHTHASACGFVSSYLIDITYGTCMAVVVIHSAYFIVFITFCIQKLSIRRNFLHLQNSILDVIYIHIHWLRAKEREFTSFGVRFCLIIERKKKTVKNP